MNQGKVQAIRDWRPPQSVKEFQRFLGFANFYRRFIQNFSLLSAPLTSMLRQKPKSLSWNYEARAAYKKLQEAFCTVPILSHPELQLPFTVEVDASTTGVGAVLSQYHAETPRLHPCAYFSRKLSPAERNYDIGNFKLLAIKLPLEEWRHWLEGAQHPFTVITDHKNLEYLRSAKRLKRLAGPFSSPGSSFPSCIDPEIRMSRRIPSRVFMPPTNPPHLNLSSLQSSL